MSAIEEHLSKNIPRRLYHYTSQEGLLGIVKEKAIWASKIHFLNDLQEFSLGLSMAKDKLDELRRDPAYQEARTKINKLERALKTIGSINVCVASFSAKRDDLSQWRGYCGDSTGFSIGFDTKKLRDLASQTFMFALLPCTYKKKAQENMVEELLQAHINSIPFTNYSWGPFGS